MIICADMRYPQWNCSIVQENNVDVVLQPAAFYRDVSFATWASFRTTRAVENSCYWLGVNYAGNDYGESSLSPPWIDEQHAPTVLDNNEGCLIGRILRSALKEARQTMPFYRHMMAEAQQQQNLSKQQQYENIAGAAARSPRQQN